MNNFFETLNEEQKLKVETKLAEIIHDGGLRGIGTSEERKNLDELRENVARGMYRILND